jgi:diguanylate cyclase (GGDEF)-like protein/PAS domain S-box-containing protein
MDAVMGALDTGIIVCDAEGRITHFTPAGERLHPGTPVGMDPQEVTEYYAVTLADGTPLAAEDLPMVRALRGETVRDVRIVATREGHGSRRLSVNAQPIRDEHGAIVGAVVAQHDITARSAAEAASREAELRFRSAFEGAPIGMALVGLEGHLLRMNDAFCRTLRASVPSLIGRQVHDLAHPDDAADVDRVIGLEPDAGGAELRLRTGDGDEAWVALSASLVSDEAGRPLYLVAQVQDVTERREFERRLAQLALTDGLTGVWNRHRLQDEVERRLDHQRRYGGSGALLMLDLDGFKAVNDTLGHAAGDAVLREVADRLRARLRVSDSVARLGGDEFAVLLPEAGADEAAAVAQEVERAVSRWPVRVAGTDVDVKVSVGISLIDGGTASFAEALAGADRAMYAIKDHRYDRPGERGAVEADHLVLHVRPLADAKGGRTAVHEALARIADADGTVQVPPSGHPAVERWLLAEALAEQAAWARRGHDLHLLVGLSARTLVDAALGALVEEVLEDTGADPSRVLLAVPEAAVGDHEDALRALATRLRSRGVRLVVDEAGTGFGSFAAIERLPVDAIRPSAALGPATARAVGDAAAAMGLQVLTSAADAAAPLATVLEGAPAPPQQPEAPIRVLHCDDSDPYRALVRALLGPLEDIDLVGDTDGHAATVEAVGRLDPDVVLLDAMVGDTRPDIVDAIGAVNPDARVVVLSGHDPDEELLAGAHRHWLRKTASADDLAVAIRAAAS